jgi:hypothetical protein
MAATEQENPYPVEIIGFLACGHPCQSHGGRRLPCARCHPAPSYTLSVDPVWDSRSYWVEPRPIPTRIPITHATLRREWFLVMLNGEKRRDVLWVDDPSFL